MDETQRQTASGTMPAINREGENVLLNWEAKATVQDGKEIVHVHAWATNEDIVTFDVPEPTDGGLQVGMYLSEEKSRDQAITDVGNINFPSAVAR